MGKIYLKIKTRDGIFTENAAKPLEKSSPTTVVDEDTRIDYCDVYTKHSVEICGR